MKKLFLIILFLMSFVLQTVAQQTFKVKNYVPNEVGREWQFKNNVKDGLSPIVIKNSQKEGEKTRRDENNGDYRWQSITNKGLEIYQLYFVGNRIIEYENPVILFPTKLKMGEIYNSSTRYKTLVNKELKEHGIQTYEVKVERVEDVKTPLQTFKNCLVMRTIALRIDESGTQKGYELEEWYAKGVGAVKVVGTLFWKNAKGETTRTFRVDAELEKLKR
jgi:hypothetical protein